MESFSLSSAAPQSSRAIARRMIAAQHFKSLVQQFLAGAKAA